MEKDFTVKKLKTVLLTACMLLVSISSLGASQFTQICISDGQVTFQSSDDYQVTCKRVICCSEHDEGCLDFTIQDENLQRTIIADTPAVIKVFTPNTLSFPIPKISEQRLDDQYASFYANSLSPPEIKLNTPITSFKTVRLIL